MDFTSRMTSLLSELRRERNGEVADTMRFYGRGCGLNLGVSIPTIRSVAGGFECGHAFAEYLYRQDVRELRIAALWLADADAVGPQSFDFWAAGIVNSEIAEQAAMALFAKCGCIDELLRRWGASDDALLAYTALLASSRNGECDAALLLRTAIETICRFRDNILIGRGVVAAVVSVQPRAGEAVRRFADTVGRDGCATARYVAEELSWMLE